MRLFLTLILLLSGLSVRAAETREGDCWTSGRDYYDCQTEEGDSKSGGLPLVGDSLQTNPASLPIQRTPFGLEGLWTDRTVPKGRSKVSVSTLKGFTGIGFGIGTWAEGSFWAPDFRSHFLNTSWEPDFLAYENAGKKGLGIRLGSAIKLPLGLPKGIILSVGGSFGLSNVKNSYSKQIGVAAQVYRLAFGYSQSFENLSPMLPRPRVDTFTTGLFLGPFFLGYTDQTVKSLTKKTRSKAYSLRMAVWSWVFYGARKDYRDHRGIPQHWWMGSFEQKITRRFSAIYVYGLYPRSHSLGLQLYL